MANITPIQFRTNIRRQQSNAESQKSVAAGPTSCFGTISIQGSGDFFPHITFPMHFSQRPILTCGYVVQQGASITPGFAPHITPGVNLWDLIQDQPPVVFYTGAELVIAVDGPDDGAYEIDYMFTGIAVTNPISGASTSLGGIV